MPIILWYLYILFYLLQAYFVLLVFLPLLKSIRKSKRLPLPVSVIICAKNEFDNLKENLPFILKQHYSDFEVLVMDDHSTDITSKLIQDLSKKHKQLRYIKASDSIKNKIGKKWALSEAIEQSKYKHILLTDADCRPGSLMWVEEMMAHFTGKTAIVLGIGQYQASGKWFDGLIQFETLMTAITYLSFAISGKPYMGVGRNLAYQKRLFNKSLMTESELPSGDDDLFIQKVGNSDNTTICIDQKSHTFSKSPETYREWVKQKNRHYSTAFHYNMSTKISLALLKASFYLPDILFIILMALNFHIGITLFIFAFRWIIWLLLLNKMKTKLGITYSLYLLPCYELYFFFFDVWTALINLRKKANTWK